VREYYAMAIPDYQTVMLPLLDFASDQKEHSIREAIEKLAEQFNLREAERKELLPSGRQATFDNRVAWARTYMKKAGLVESTRRGHFKITSRGLEALKKKPQAINVKFLQQYPEFVEFRSQSSVQGEELGGPEPQPTEETPIEVIEAAYQTIRSGLASELLEQVMGCSPNFFERLVVDLLVKMGYGGTRKDAGQAVGKSGDEGIDGIINEDRLGLEVVYIQAKRWKDTVGRPEIQKFVGALQGQNARKGIFITTSSFSSAAIEYVKALQNKVVLIDGEMLASLMIDNSVGVSLVEAYEVKRVDSDYFSEA
jgi:restriction system protein